MKAINAGVFISIFIIGIEYQVKAQTVHKAENRIEVEHKIKEEPVIVKEPEIKSEAHPETPLPPAPVEDHRASPLKEEAKTGSENNTNPAQTKMPSPELHQISRSQLRKSPGMKPFVLDTIKK
jgi:hypothetical protein